VRLAANGVEVVLGSRSKERGEEVAAEVLADLSRPLPLSGESNESAAAAEVLVLATPWEGAVATAIELREVLAGKVLVSMVNALARVGREFQAIMPARGSIAASVQAVLPETAVTAAFQHLPARELGDLDHVLESDVLICSDTRAAAEVTSELVDTIPGLRGVFAGSLASANAVEALTAVLLNVNVTYRTHVALRLPGLPER
jgi:NADPH-dependent F420 reductase